MEILAEILLAILQLLGELLLQLVAEALAEFGLGAIREAIAPSKPTRPAVAAVGYILLGGLFGLLSLWPFPHSFASHPWLRIANLLIVPPLTGVGIVTLGRWRMKRGRARLYLHQFAYAFLFAFVFALVRFVVIK